MSIPIPASSAHEVGLLHHVISGMHMPTLAHAGSALLAGIGLVVACLVLSCLYNLFLHPLRHFPGPKLAAMTRIPLTMSNLSGRHPHDLLVLHEKYGAIVRTGPDAISIQHPEAYPETRGFRKELPKDPIAVRFLKDNLVGADKPEHARFRRILSHGFSASVMQEQEPLIKSYVDKLMAQLHARCEGGKRPLDMAKWFNFTTFDVIGDLSFGEPFGCLDNEDYHPWVALIVQSTKDMAYTAQLAYWNHLEPLLRRYVMPKGLSEKWATHGKLSEEKVKKRLASGVNRPDFIQKMVEGSAKGSDGMNHRELVSHAQAIIIAGSETTATALTSATYLLATHPDTLACLSAEIRNAFAADDDITMASVQRLPYLQAVIDETLRYLPSTPIGLSRTVRDQPAEVCGQSIPVGTLVEVAQYVIHRDPKLFHQADKFIPERWFKNDPKFANDQLDSVHPFSVGPRACIGRNLALAEFRTILARFIWNFDIRIDDSSRSFESESRIYMLWQRPAMKVYLTPRMVKAKEPQLMSA